MTCYYVSASDDGTHDLLWSRTQDFVTELQSTAVAVNQYVTFLSPFLANEYFVSKAKEIEDIHLKKVNFLFIFSIKVKKLTFS